MSPPPAASPVATLPVPRVAYLGEIASPDLVTPTRIAVTPSDEIVVSDARGADVHLFSARGAPRSRIAGTLVRPLGVAAGLHGELHVGDAGDGSVRTFDRAGRLLRAFGSGAGEVAMASDLAVDPANGTVFVVDGRRDQVRVFGADGTPLRAFGTRGAAPGQLSFPTGILLDPAGSLLVVDHDNARIEAFSTTGELRPPVLGGTLSGAPGGMVRPQGIARDSIGRLYVADAFQGVVQVLDPTNGAHVAYVGTPGKGSGQMALPSDAVVDRFGRLLVTSYDTGKVLVYGIDDWVMPPPDPLAAAVTLEPAILHARDRGRTLTVRVEVTGRDASEIVAAGAILRVGDRELEAYEPRGRSVGDHDRDGVRELSVEFPRRELVAALGTPGPHEVVFASRMATGEAVEGRAVVVLAEGRGER